MPKYEYNQVFRSGVVEDTFYFAPKVAVLDGGVRKVIGKKVGISEPMRKLLKSYIVEKLSVINTFDEEGVKRPDLRDDYWGAGEYFRVEEVLAIFNLKHTEVLEIIEALED